MIDGFEGCLEILRFIWPQFLWKENILGCLNYFLSRDITKIFLFLNQQYVGIWTLSIRVGKIYNMIIWEKYINTHLSSVNWTKQQRFEPGREIIGWGLVRLEKHGLKISKISLFKAWSFMISDGLWEYLISRNPKI